MGYKISYSNKGICIPICSTSILNKYNVSFGDIL